MKNVITLLIILSSITSYAGEGGSGGGPKASMGKVSIAREMISDIRTKDENITPLGEFELTANSLISKPGANEVIFNLDAKSDIKDVQLIDGTIIKLTRD